MAAQQQAKHLAKQKLENEQKILREQVEISHMIRREEEERKQKQILDAIKAERIVEEAERVKE